MDRRRHGCEKAGLTGWARAGEGLSPSAVDAFFFRRARDGRRRRPVKEIGRKIVQAVPRVAML